MFGETLQSVIIFIIIGEGLKNREKKREREIMLEKLINWTLGVICGGNQVEGRRLSATPATADAIGGGRGRREDGGGGDGALGGGKHW